MRERGIEFVDGTAPGFAACVGACPTNEQAVKLARELQEKMLYEVAYPDQVLLLIGQSICRSFP